MTFHQISTSRQLLMGLFLICFTACGYRFSGSGRLPSHVERIVVHIFENRTSETGIENVFTNDLIDEFTRKNISALAEADSADAYLSGVIRTISVETISHLDQYASLERRVTVTVDIKLISKNGEVLKNFRGLSESEAFDVTQGQKFATEQNQRNAMMSISKRLSETIYKMLTDDF
ncbi:MAG: hypothetical protein KJ737_08910 [Proteobacteria bacterium]|nr:hypothetical protein [Pseudomonadota bacterium]